MNFSIRTLFTSCLIFFSLLSAAEDYIDKESTSLYGNNDELTPNSTFKKTNDVFLKTYKLKKTNVLKIFVEQDPSINGQYTVNDNGEIDIPYLGKVNIESKTIFEATQYIELLLAKDLIRNPVVTLDLLEYTKSSISISGQVIKPGNYTFVDRITLTDLIKLAGGFAKHANKSVIIISNTANPSHISEKKVINFNSILNGQQKNPIITNNQNIFVDALLPIVVDGGVEKPGVVYVEPGLTLREVIEIAGGFSKMADLSSIIVRSASIENKYDYMSIINSRKKLPEILPNDHIIVSQCSKKFNVLGKTICIK